MPFPYQSGQNRSLSLFSVSFEDLRFCHFRQCILYYPMFINSYFFIQSSEDFETQKHISLSCGSKVYVYEL